MDNPNENRPSLSPSFIRRLRDDVGTFREMMRDFRKRTYPKVPLWSIASIAVALVYIVSPADLISDWIPVLGQLDDAGIVSLAWMLVRRDLGDYRRWRESGGADSGTDGGADGGPDSSTHDLGDEIPHE